MTLRDLPGPRGVPAAGILHRFARRPLTTLVEAARDHGDVVRLDLGPRRFLLVTRPEHVRRVLQDNGRNYVRGYGRVGLFVGDGLLASEGQTWLEHRRLMQPAFHRRSLEGFAATMASEARDACERWISGGGRPVNVLQEMLVLARRIIVRTMFSDGLGADDRRVVAAFEDVLAYLDRAVLLPDWFARLPLPARGRFFRAKAELDDAIFALIRERRRRGAEGAERGDLLSMLLSARDEETGEGMGDRQARDEVVSIYVAGFETVAVALSWAFYCLSVHAGAARAVREEVDDVLGGRAPTAADAGSLPRTRAFADEVLRLYPPVWAFSRRAVADDELGGHRVPAGSLVMLSPYATHRRPDVWQNPEGFDPGRFEDDPSGAGAPRCAYLPFGAGGHRCIGRNYALMEMVLVLAAVSQRCRLDLPPASRVSVEGGGVRFSLTPRPALVMRPTAVPTAPAI